MQNRFIFEQILENLEKGNSMENKFTTDNEKLDKKLTKNLNLMTLDLKAKITDSDYKVDRFLAMMDEKFSKINSELDTMEAAEVLRDFTLSEVKSTREGLLKKMIFESKENKKKFEDIYSNHLLRQGLIGPESDCKFKTVVDYAVTHKTDTLKKFKKSDEEIEKAMVILKNFQTRMH